jgi:hypothetical protein
MATPIHQLLIGSGLFLSLMLHGSALKAEPEQIQRPTGLFVAKGPEPTPEREVNFPFITGFLVRPGWDQVEPADGRFDWSYIDGEIATAKRLGKKVALAILGGPQTPGWVYESGASSFSYVWGGRYKAGADARIPILWDAVYLTKWTELIAALGKRYGEDRTIVLVHMTGATENGLEMQLPAGKLDRERWAKAGYNPRKAIAAWKTIVDAFSQAFPHTALDLDVHPVLGSSEVAEAVAAYASSKLGKRFGLYGGWLSGKSARQDPHHAAMHVLVQKYGREGFADFQMIGNESRQPERFASGGLRAAVDQAMHWGARYFEVWRADVINPRMHATLRELAEKISKAETPEK